MSEPARKIGTFHAAAGEAPETLRHRLKDADTADEPREAVDLGSLHAAARERDPEDASPKRSWRKR